MHLSSLPTEEGGGDSLTCNCGATHVKSTPITVCVPFCKCPWALAMYVGARGGWALTVCLTGKTMSILCDTIVLITDYIKNPGIIGPHTSCVELRSLF